MKELFGEEDPDYDHGSLEAIYEIALGDPNVNDAAKKWLKKMYQD